MAWTAWFGGVGIGLCYLVDFIKAKAMLLCCLVFWLEGSKDGIWKQAKRCRC